jgi:hypothetical protein
MLNATKKKKKKKGKGTMSVIKKLKMSKGDVMGRELAWQ